MTWPPADLPIDFQNATPQENTHPDAHNATNQTINADLVPEIIRVGELAETIGLYLPLTGGTLTGDLQVDGQLVMGGNWANAFITSSASSGREYMNIAAQADGGSGLRFYGGGDASYPGNAYIYSGGGITARFDEDQNTKLYKDLQVDGKLTVKSDGGAYNPAIAFDGIDGMGIYASSTGNYIRFGVSGVQKLGIKEDVVVVNTDLQVDGQTKAQNGTLAKPAYSFASDPDSGLYRQSADVLELVVGGERAIQVGKTGSSLDGFWAPGVYRKTTTERYNVTVGGDGGHLVRSTASRSALQQIEPVHRAAVHSVLELEPIWYRSKCENDNPNLSQYGFAAEDVAAIDPRLATNVEDANGNLVPDNVDVVAIAALLVGVVKEQHQQISDLTARVEALEAAS